MSSPNSVLYCSCTTLNDSLNKTLDQCIMCCFIHIFLPYLVVQTENDYPYENLYPTLPSPTLPSTTYPENFFHIMDRE